MSAPGRGGRRASLPPSGWQAPERLLTTADGMGTTVVFYQEKTGKRREFDCSAFPVPQPMLEWLCRLMADRFSARSGIKSIGTARITYLVAKWFAETVDGCAVPASTPADLAPAHMEAFRDRYRDNPETSRKYIKVLRLLLRGSTDLPQPFRDDLLRTRLPAAEAAPELDSYTDWEWQQIMTALRRDVRTARDRIRAGKRTLVRFRAGELAVGSDEEALGRLLDGFARTGDVPRDGFGNADAHTRAHGGGYIGVAQRLCLSQHEATAFALLLAALTAENFGTVATWPAAHTRPDGGFGPVNVALAEEVKPRRGPEREHMIVALEDLPSGLASVINTESPDARLFRSPLRVYELLLELTEVARTLSGSRAAFVSHAPWSAKTSGEVWTSIVDRRNWARTRGFPIRSAKESVQGTKPAVTVGRIRQTALEMRRQPVAQTGATLRDHYLRRSSTVRKQSKQVVAEALRAEVTKARSVTKVPVFRAELLERALRDLEATAAEVGLTPQVLKDMMAGESDTVATACVDHLARPGSPPGEPCTASFLACLGCENARALPHQLPIQTAVHDRLLALRPHVEPAGWHARYGEAVAQLQDILSTYTASELRKARADLSDRQADLVDDLLNGRMDLR